MAPLSSATLTSVPSMTMPRLPEPLRWRCSARMRSVVSRIRCPVLMVKNSVSRGWPDSPRVASAPLTSISSITGLLARQYFSVVPLRLMGAVPLVLQSTTSKIPKWTGFTLAGRREKQPARKAKPANRPLFTWLRMPWILICSLFQNQKQSAFRIRRLAVP
jgi:hypothetical protein